MAPFVVARRALLLPALVATAAPLAEVREAPAQLPSQPIVQTDAVPRYNCEVEYDIWQTAWTPDWKTWCCENRQRGCPSTTTVTKTTSTSTATTTRTTTRTTTEDPEACSAFCMFENVNATCSARIVWAVSHLDLSCKAARKLVVKQCSLCGQCSTHLMSKIKECEAEEEPARKKHGEDEKKADEQEKEEKHKHGEGKKHVKPDAVFLAKKFVDDFMPGGTPAQRAYVGPVFGAAVVATAAALAMGLRRCRRARGAMLMEVPLGLVEANE